MKAATLVASIAIISSAVLVQPQTAKAHDGALVGGLAGGLLGGLVIGSALAPRPYYYYEPGPAYVAAPAYAYSCYWTRGAAYWDDYRGIWVRPRVRVCD
jgi:hypothetical protein